jgi:predicted DCC family thiol-disulfide oxidoreductase YuxK
MEAAELMNEGSKTGNTKVPGMVDQPYLLLFDGVCNLCQGVVQFIIERDPEGYFTFASQQSEVGQALLARLGIATDADGLGTGIVLLRGDQYWTASTAVLQIVRHLRRGWPLIYAGIILPRRWRDALYFWVGRHRYGWFGKQEACWLPRPELAARFAVALGDVPPVSHLGLNR